MIGYKGFNKKLQCTLGKGVFQYEVGKTYEEEEANCARNGFHFVEEPIRVLDWYEDGRWCMVDAQDVHEDGTDKVAAKKMTIIKELTLKQLLSSIESGDCGILKGMCTDGDRNRCGNV